jgi:ABC-type ATPase with predicted acetyltransferase domain
LIGLTFDIEFSRAHNARAYIAKVKQVKHRPYKCNYCGKRFRTATGLQWHLEHSCPEVKSGYQVKPKSKRTEFKEGLAVEYLDYTAPTKQQPAKPMSKELEDSIRRFNKEIEIEHLRGDNKAASAIEDVKQAYLNANAMIDRINAEFDRKKAEVEAEFSRYK